VRLLAATEREQAFEETSFRHQKLAKPLFDGAFQESFFDRQVGVLDGAHGDQIDLPSAFMQTADMVIGRVKGVEKTKEEELRFLV
jgi:hypothetical protein